MRIKSIELNNYRLYKGNNTIHFRDNVEKNIFLISGQNGFGKTTFLHSLLWCLYGKLMIDVDEAFRKEMFNSKYINTLNKNLNEEQRRKLSGESTNTINTIKRNGYSNNNEHVKEYAHYFVAIEFCDVIIPSIPCHTIKITRTFDVIREEESVEILIDGIKNELTTEIGNDIFINDFLLNKDIARFFFFDSEKIVSLADSNTVEEKRKLCSAYNEVLGVKKYEDLKKNLENLRLRFRRKSSDLEFRNKLNEYLSKKVELTELINNNEQDINNYIESLSNLRQKDEILQMQLFREGSNTTISELNRLEDLLKNVRVKDDKYKQDIKLFLEFAPFAIAGKLLNSTKEQIENDYLAKQSTDNIRNHNFILHNIMSEMIDSFEKTSLHSDTKQQLINDYQKIISKYQDHKTYDNPLLNITHDNYQEFMSIYTNITTTFKFEFERLADDYKKNKQILERTVRNISNIQSKEKDNVIKNIRTKKNQSEQKIIHLEQGITKLHEDKGVLNKELTTINKHITELSKKISLDDSDLVKDELASQLIKELDNFLITLKKEKKISLELKIKNTLNALMHKSDFVNSVDIVVINDILDINLYNTSGELINKELLSKGEQQLYATSILKGLVEESGIEFPIFIDSPLQKFDKSHANKIITEFYPSISKQVILFPLLHKELTKNELDILEPYVNATFLIKNTNNRSYLQEVNINELMKD